jgi:DNA-binding CsgD family transcriptional regulator
MSAILMDLAPVAPTRPAPAALRFLELLRAPYALFDGEQWTYASRAAVALLGNPLDPMVNGSWWRVSRMIKERATGTVQTISVERGCQAQVSDGAPLGIRETIVLLSPAESARGGVDLDSFGLTSREQDVARLIALGRSTKAVATELGISFSTARHHTERVYAKLRVHGRVEVALLLGGG